MGGFEDSSRLEPLIVQTADVVLRAVGLTKTYAAHSKTGHSKTGPRELELFKELDLEVHAGEMVAIVGESGVGEEFPAPRCWRHSTGLRLARCGAGSRS